MFNNDQLKELVKKAREATPKRNFAQSAEITLVLKDIDVKKGFSVNEIVVLPNPTKKGSSLCMLATGDMGLRAKKAGVDQVMEPDTLDRIGTNRREASYGCDRRLCIWRCHSHHPRGPVCEPVGTRE